MRKMERREFIKLAGTGAGAILASSLFHDRLLAGELPPAGASLWDDRFGVSQAVMAEVLRSALSKGGDFADLFFEYKILVNVTMEDDIIRQSSESVIRGVGIRVLKGRQTGFGYTSSLIPESMNRAALTAAAIASSGVKVRLPDIRERRPDKQVYLLDKLLPDAPLEDRLALVKEAYSASLAYDKRIVKAIVRLNDEMQYVTIVNSEGLMISDARPQVRLYVTAMAQEGQGRSAGNSSAAGRVGYAFFRRPGSTPEETGQKAAQEALALLSAVNPAVGEQPVVLGGGAGVMIHEAVGHPLEGEGIWRKTSIVWDKLGQMVANPAVTIYEDATLPELRGSLNIDDEGTPTRKTMMIEKGKLSGFLLDRLSAGILGLEPNGHGRRDSYRSFPLCRMTNTILAKGEASPEDILRTVKKGFYAVAYEGGVVGSNGQFTFSVHLGYLIEDGRLTRPVKNATLIGSNLQVLKDIELVGNDQPGNYFRGVCLRGGQSAAVTGVTPTFKIRQMTIGGRL